MLEVGMQRLQIKDGYVCKYCAADIWMDQAMLPHQTAEEIKEHLRYRSENKKIIETFQVTREIQAGSYYFRIDDHKKQWCGAEKYSQSPGFFVCRSCRLRILGRWRNDNKGRYWSCCCRRNAFWCNRRRNWRANRGKKNKISCPKYESKNFPAQQICEVL